MKRFLGVLLALLVPSVVMAQLTWDAAFEGTPAFNDPVADGDDRIRELKTEERARMAVELCIGNGFTGASDGCPAAGTGSDDNGRLREGAARVFFQTAAPTVLVNPDYDNGGGGGSDTLDDGRIFIDEDTPSSTVHRLKVYNETAAAFEDVEVLQAVNLATPSSDADILQGSFNAIYNGGFEATDGTGDTTSTTVPIGWTTIGTTTYTYSATDTSEGVGVELNATAVGANDGLEVQLTGLKASTKYKVVVRAKDNGASDCSVQVDAKGGTNMAKTDTSAGGTYETVTGTFTTDASADADLELIADTAVVCSWDHVAVYEMRDETAVRNEIPQSGATVVRAAKVTSSGDVTCDTSYTGLCIGSTTGLTVDVTPPGPGYIIMVSTGVQVQQTATNGDCYIRIFDGSSTIAESMWENPIDGNMNTMYTSRTIVNPTPGTTLTLRTDVRETGTGTCSIEDDVESFIEAVLIPTR